MKFYKGQIFTDLYKDPQPDEIQLEILDVTKTHVTYVSTWVGIEPSPQKSTVTKAELYEIIDDHYDLVIIKAEEFQDLYTKLSDGETRT
jgi:predicted glycosyltransferase